MVDQISLLAGQQCRFILHLLRVLEHSKCSVYLFEPQFFDGDGFHEGTEADLLLDSEDGVARQGAQHDLVADLIHYLFFDSIHAPPLRFAQFGQFFLETGLED